MFLLRALVAFVLLMNGVATVAAPQLPDLYVMRHLEYRGEGSHARLTEVGANNARRLSHYSFNTRPPVAIYTATEQVSLDSSAWLSIELRVNPKLFDPQKIDALMADLAQERGPVLVIASKDYASEIIARATGKPAPDIQEGAFGEIWVISGRDRSVVKRSFYETDANQSIPAPANQSGRVAPTASWLDEGEIAER